MLLSHMAFAIGLVLLSAQSAPDSLAGTAWNAVEVNGTAVPKDVGSADRRPHLIFGTDGRLSGADGCNRLAGPYTATGNSLSFGQVVGTQMACRENEQLAQRFRAALSGTTRWRVVDGRLTLYGVPDKPLAVFERRTAAGAALQGTAWPLRRFEDATARTE